MVCVPKRPFGCFLWAFTSPKTWVNFHAHIILKINPNICTLNQPSLCGFAREKNKNCVCVCVCLSGCQQSRGGCREGASGAGGEAETQQEPRGQGHGLSLRKSQGSSGRGGPLTTQPRRTHRSARTHTHTSKMNREAEINQLESHKFFLLVLNSAYDSLSFTIHWLHHLTLCTFPSFRFREGEEGEHASSSWGTCQHLLLRPDGAPGYVSHVHLTGNTHAQRHKLCLLM